MLFNTIVFSHQCGYTPVYLAHVLITRGTLHILEHMDACGNYFTSEAGTSTNVLPRRPVNRPPTRLPTDGPSFHDRPVVGERANAIPHSPVNRLPKRHPPEWVVGCTTAIMTA
jgi:hypothetical protein